MWASPSEGKNDNPSGDTLRFVSNYISVVSLQLRALICSPGGHRHKTTPGEQLPS